MLTMTAIIEGLSHRHDRNDGARPCRSQHRRRRVRRGDGARRAAASRPCSTSWACSIARPAAPTSSTARTSPASPKRSSADTRKQNIGFIFQSFNLIDELSVRENVELALLYHDMPAERAQGAGRGGARQGRHRPSRRASSGATLGRAAAAGRGRAGAGRAAQLILADEPTGNLDTAHGEEVMRMLRQLNEEGSTIVMVTHSPSHADYASRVVNMLDGRILVERRRAA